MRSHKILKEKCRHHITFRDSQKKSMRLEFYHLRTTVCKLTDMRTTEMSKDALRKRYRPKVKGDLSAGNFDKAILRGYFMVMSGG